MQSLESTRLLNMDIICFGSPYFLSSRVFLFNFLLFNLPYFKFSVTYRQYLRQMLTGDIMHKIEDPGQLWQMAYWRHLLYYVREGAAFAKASVRHWLKYLCFITVYCKIQLWSIPKYIAIARNWQTGLKNQMSTGRFRLSLYLSRYCSWVGVHELQIWS